MQEHASSRAQLTKSPQPLSPEVRKALYMAARRVAENAFAPYSGFRVGAALLLEGGEIIVGCNVEIASYRLTSCAEQGAVARAVAEHGPALRLRAVALANLNEAASTPCGACRQTLAEFSDDYVTILYPDERGRLRETTLGELLPQAFRLQRGA